jgi:NADH-quinone oxidoreductase subunit L
MLGLIIANSLLLFFICWELVGLASYLLIGFWFQKPSAAAAAKKAFIVTRIGDLGFLVGMLWLYAKNGHASFL